MKNDRWKKWIKILFIVIAITVSITINFDTYGSLSKFVGKFVIFFALIYFSLSFFHQKPKLIKIILLIIAWIIVLVGYFVSAQFGSLSGCRADLAYFKTNILTGECNFGLEESCDGDLWYLKKGCNINDEEKINIIKESSQYPRTQKFCEYFQEQKPNESIPVTAEISCQDLNSV